MSEGLDDRRLFDRYDCELFITAKRQSNLDQVHILQGIDISIGGVRVSYNAPFSEGEILDMNITLSDDQEHIEAEGQVRYAFEETGVGYTMGIQFTSIKKVPLDRFAEQIEEIFAA
jgi:hypothetical protein